MHSRSHTKGLPVCKRRRKRDSGTCLSVQEHPTGEKVAIVITASCSPFVLDYGIEVVSESREACSQGCGGRLDVWMRSRAVDTCSRAVLLPLSAAGQRQRLGYRLWVYNHHTTFWWCQIHREINFGVGREPGSVRTAKPNGVLLTR